MTVSHARDTAVTSTDEEPAEPARGVPGLLGVLAQVPDPRKLRGRRFLLVFVLAVAVACALAGSKSFREIGDQAADLPQEILARSPGEQKARRRAGRRPAPRVTRFGEPGGL